MRVYEYRDGLAPKEKKGLLRREIADTVQFLDGNIFEVLEHYRSSVSFLEEFNERQRAANVTEKSDHELNRRLLLYYSEMLAILRQVFGTERDREERKGRLRALAACDERDFDENEDDDDRYRGCSFRCDDDFPGTEKQPESLLGDEGKMPSVDDATKRKKGESTTVHAYGEHLPVAKAVHSVFLEHSESTSRRRPVGRRE